MGAKDSKASCLSYDEAVKRLYDHELKRLTEAFKHTSNLNTSISKRAFIKDVLGDFVPLKLSEQIFQAFGGTNKGITFKDLICGLVTLIRGRKEEKYRFLFSLCANETGSYVHKHEMYKLVQACDGGVVSEEVAACFRDSDKVTWEEFRSWLSQHENASSLTQWLLQDKSSVTLFNEQEMPTFYQTLAGVTHLEEKDIVELEKHYWFLKTKSKTGKFDLETLRPLISPCIPSHLCEGVFNAFDENQDGHIDFKEMACGISACCRGPLVERLKFCFKMFDSNRDGALTCQEVHHMVSSMLHISRECELRPGEILNIDDKEVSKIMKTLGFDESKQKTAMTLDDYLVLMVGMNLPQDLLELLYQVCHVVFGLRPSTKEKEGAIIREWVEREERRGLQVAQIWFLVDMGWWRAWNDYIDSKHDPGGGSTPILDPIHTRHRSPAKLQKKVEGSVAQALSDSSGNVILSSVSSLASAVEEFHGSNSDLSGSGNFFSGTSSENSLASQESSASRKTLQAVNTSGTSHVQRLHSPLSMQPPSMIDNSSLVIPNSLKAIILTHEGGRLRPGLTRGVDFALVPEAVWYALCQWYGGSPALPRQVILPPNSEPELELYPISLRLYRHQAPLSKPPPASTTAIAANAWSGTISAYATVGGSGGPLYSGGGQSPKRYLAYVATFSRLATLQQVFEFLCKRLRLRHEDARLWLIRDHESNLIPLEEENATLEELHIQDLEQILIEVRNKDQTWPEEMSYLMNAKNQSNQGPTEKGATGLNNLGNTCFMNAAVQCVSNTRPLTKYFILNKHLFELNRTNPLGMKGHIAKRYGDLVHDLWSGTSKTIAPLKLRWTIAKYAPRFNGFLQHDSQEFLAFLMDGLHEDLNRVEEKTYRELQDSDGRPDAEVAREAWENHLLRNRSIIVDLFHGQLQSSVRCAACGHTSVTFDPFNYLSLPLPMEASLHIEVVVIRLDGSIPVKYGLRLNQEERYIGLKLHLSHLCGLPVQKLLLAEITGSLIKGIPNDDHRVKVVAGNFLFAYEILDTYSGPVEVDYDHRFVTLGASQNLSNGNALGKLGDMTTSDSDANGNPAPNVASLVNIANSETSSMTSSWTASDSPDISLSPTTCSTFLIAYHRKMIRQDIYFHAAQKTRAVLFGLPVLLPFCPETMTHRDIYAGVWKQVSRLVSPAPASSGDHGPPLNHAQDCDNSLGYEFPFTLKLVTNDGLYCALCPWFKFCQGCPLVCSDQLLGHKHTGVLAIDWDPTALHLRYQTSQERVFIEDASVATAWAKHTEPVSLHDCLDAFTSEELLEEKYPCSKCACAQPATKKLLIWRLPPILIIHLKRFQLVQGKWVKSHKMVRFPFTDFDPTNYLAPLPKQIMLDGRQKQRIEENTSNSPDSANHNTINDHPKGEFEDIHQHRLHNDADPFSPKYKLYAVACHSGILGGGHYICYACNPNNKWYCYNDSSCKEVQPDQIDSAYMLLYEREGIDYDKYMPDVTGKSLPPDLHDLDSELEAADLRKLCCLQ